MRPSHYHRWEKGAVCRRCYLMRRADKHRVEYSRDGWLWTASRVAPRCEGQ